MQCPRCSDVALSEENFADLQIDRCPSCHGMWLDALELEKLIEADPRPLLAEDRTFHSDPREEGARIDCPRCKGARLIKLNSRHRPGTIIDSCTVCFGTWLDAGELARLAKADFAGRIRSLFGR